MIDLLYGLVPGAVVIGCLITGLSVPFWFTAFLCLLVALQSLQIFFARKLADSQKRLIEVQDALLDRRE